ncbi:MAG: propanediol utilization protein, partial [Clostridia bacterium]|nr:propanediol utilization protein [Clostridia bacterium]
MKKEVLIETSARHVHVTREALDILFGEGYELTKKKDL